MRAITRFRHLMSSTIQVAAQTGTDAAGYGKPSYGAATTYKCHLRRQPKLVRAESGQEVVSPMGAHLDSADAILPTAQVTLSTGDVGSTQATLLSPPIVAVERRFDQDGPHHTVLHFG